MAYIIQESDGHHRSHVFKKKAPKYQKGIAPCGACNLNEHKACRPRMDGTLCSCSCKRAVALRTESEAMIAAEFTEVEVNEGLRVFSNHKNKKYFK